MNTQEPYNITLRKIPDGLYELSWIMGEKKVYKFLNKSGIVKMANNLKAYRQLRGFCQEKLREGLEK